MPGESPAQAQAPESAAIATVTPAQAPTPLMEKAPAKQPKQPPKSSTMLNEEEADSSVNTGLLQDNSDSKTKVDVETSQNSAGIPAQKGNKVREPLENASSDASGGDVAGASQLSTTLLQGIGQPSGSKCKMKARACKIQTQTQIQADQTGNQEQLLDTP